MRLAGPLGKFLNQHAAGEALMTMAEQSLRHQFNKWAPKILNGIVAQQTLEVDLADITSQLAAFDFAAVHKPRTAEQQLQDVLGRQALQDLKDTARARNLQLEYRIEAGKDSAHAAKIFADVALVEFTDKKVRDIAASRKQAPFWPLRHDTIRCPWALPQAASVSAP